MEVQREIKKKMIVTGFASLMVIIVIIGGIMYAAQKNIPDDRQAQKKPLRHVAETPVPTRAPVTGIMNVGAKINKASYVKGETVTLVITADSKGDTIAGYDAVLRYDPTMFAFSKATSLVEGMDLFQTEENADQEGFKEYIITGIQSLAQKDPFIFANTPIAEVSFTVKKSGESSIDMVFEPGSTTDSNLMNTQTMDVLSDANGMMIKAQ